MPSLTSDISQALIGKELLIFDLDGTVADTVNLHAAAFEKVLSPLGISVDYPSIAGMNTADAICYCTNAHGLNPTEDQIRELRIAKQIAVRKLITLKLLPIPDADWFLQWSRKFYHLSMATSGSWGTVRLSLNKLGLVDWFDPLVCANDVERAKPYPDAFLKVLSLTGYRPEQALIFEDSESGFAAAEAAGICCVKISKKSWTEFKSQIQ